MAGRRMKPKKDNLDEELVEMLFGEEIGSLCDDGFEGSSNERQIFMEILCQNDTGNASKSHVVSSSVKFEVEDSNYSNALFDIICKDSAGASLIGLKESPGNHVRPASELFEFSSVKRLKPSDGVPSNENNVSSSCLSDVREEPFQSKRSKEVVCNGHVPDFVCTGETITCHLVESCSQGIVSSCFLLRPHGEIDFVDDAEERKAYNKIRAASPIQKFVKKVTVSKSILTPVYQESFVSKLLPNGAITPIEETLVAPVLPKEGSQESDIPKSGTAAVTCVLSGQQRGKDVVYDTVDDRASNRERAARSRGRYIEEASALKAIVPPGLQERSLSDILLDGAITSTEEVPVTPLDVKEDYQESDSSKSVVADVTSGCRLLGQLKEANIADRADEGYVPNMTEATNHLCEYAEEVVASKAVMHATSEECCALKPFSNSDIAALGEMTLVPVPVKQVPDESFLLKLDAANVLSGCDFLRQHRETDVIDETDDGKASNETELLSPHGECVNEVTLPETIMPPGSQESCVSKLSSNIAISSEEVPVDPRVVTGRLHESDLSKSGYATVTSERDFQLNLCTNDQKQVNQAESSSQDVLSSCVPLKQCRIMDTRDETEDKKTSNKTKKVRPHERSDKKVATLKAIMSPVSPKSSASQLSPTGAVATNELKPIAFGVAEEGSQESDFLQSGMSSVTCREHLKRNLRARHKHIDLVESSSLGDVSSCAMLKRSRENTAEVESLCGSDDKKDAKLKAVKFSVSEESSPSTLLLTGVTNATEEKPRATNIGNEGFQEVDLSVTGMVDEASQEDFIRNLRPRLREHISAILEAAGWGVVIRERMHRLGYFDTLFASPKQKLICKLPKAWRSCGKSLFTGGIHRVQKENMREWTDINEFWNDLSITLAYIEKDMQETEMCLSLAKRWCLLDPFVIMVCIDRRIGVLRSGKAVKVVNGISVVSKMPVRSRRKYVRKNQSLDGDQVGSSNDSLGQVSKSATLYLEPSKSLDLKSDESVFMANTTVCMTEGELLPLDLNVEIEGTDTREVKQRTKKRVMQSGHNQHCEQLITEEQMRCWHPQEENLCIETIDTTQDDVMIPELHCPFQSNRESESLKQSNHLDELIGSAFEASNSEMEYASTAVQGISPVEEMRRAQKKKNGHTRKKFKSILEVKTIKSVSKHKKANLAEQPSVESQSSNFSNFDREQGDFAPDDLKKSRKFYGSMIASVHNGKLLMANPQSEISMAEQQMSFFFPCENLCDRVDGNCQEDVLAHGKTQPNQNCSDVDGKIENRLDLSVHQVKPGITFASKFARGAASATGREIAKMILANGPEMGLTKRRSKKSRKISEIKAAKSNSVQKPGLFMPREIDSQNVDFINLNKGDKGILHGHFRKQKYLMGDDRKGSVKTSIDCSQYQCISSSKLNKFQRLTSDVKEFVAITHNLNGLIQVKCENDIEEVCLPCATDESVDPQPNRKFPKMKKSADHNENGRKGLRPCPIDDDDLLIAAFIKNKDFSSNSKPKAARKLKSQKGKCKLLVRSLGKGGKMDIKFSMGTRTVLSRLLDAGAVTMDEVIQYRNPKDGAVIKDGRVTRDGIFCKCCNRMLSVSEFKIHAGFKQQKPCLHLFLESGKSFTLCQLQAWSSEYKVRKGSIQKVVDEVDENDDTCGICGDGGELICCDNCPSTFHQSCLFAQELPEGNWYCANCTCGICGKLVNEKEVSSSLVGSQCSQCEHKYHMTCIHGEHMQKEAVSEPWFCGGNCQKVYSGLHSRIGVLNNISDGFSWMLLRCIHGDQKVYSAQRFALMAECNIKLAVALGIMEECFVPMVDPRTGINMIPHVLYNWGSEFARLNYQGFYTVVLEKDDKIISVASIRVHGVTVAEMPLIATCSEHRRQGMCRRLMNEIEEMLKSFGVQMLVISAIPNLVDTWTSGFGFRPIDVKEREELNSVNLMVFPGTTLLKKSLNGMDPVETKQTGLDIQLSPQAMESTEKQVCNETNSLASGLKFAGDSCSVGADHIENSALQNCRNSPLEQTEDKLRHSTSASCGELRGTHGGSVHEDLSSLDCFCVREGIEPMDICDARQLVSTKSVLSNEMSAANATSTISSNLPTEEICGAYVGKLKIAEAHFGVGLVAGAVDANSVDHSDVASHEDEITDLADGELGQLTPISILRESSKDKGKLHASAGTNFSVEKAPISSTNKLFESGKADGSHFGKPNTLDLLCENYSHPHGNSVDFMLAAATSGETDGICASQTGYSDCHIDSTHLIPFAEVCKKHEDTIIGCLMGGKHEHQDNSSGQEPESPVLNEQNWRNQGNEVEASTDSASEKLNNSQNDCCFTSSTKLAPSVLVKPVCQAPSPKISIQASGLE